MNPLDIALQEAVNTIAQLQARIFNLAIEIAGLKQALKAKNDEKNATPAAGQ